MSRHAHPFGAYHIDALPAQPQIAHCHGFFVPKTLRGQGCGKHLKAAQHVDLRNGLYDFAICTVDSENLIQQHILTQASWHQLADFNNSKTGGVTELWGRPVYQEQHP